MKPRLFLSACLALMAGLLSAQNIFGAFQIYTEPQGASITIYGTNQYLGSTPSQAIPVTMDQYMTYNWGVPGRVFDLLISKPGFIPMRQQIFVPYNHKHQHNALRNPTVFQFNLVRQQIQPPHYWPNWNPTAYYYYVDPWPGNSGPGGGYNPGGPGHGPGCNPSGPGGNNQGGHGNNNGNHNGSGHNPPSGGHGGGHGNNNGNNNGPGRNPPSGGHAGQPRP